MKQYLGIDLGTANTVIYSSITDDVIFSEPSCIAYQLPGHSLKETGFLANKIQERSPFKYEVVNPVTAGNIADDDAAFDFISKIIKDLRLDKKYRAPTLVFTAPSKCTKVNRKAIVEIGKRMYAKEVYIESQAKIAALGASEKVYAPTATLICQIGAGISDIALLSMGEVVCSETSYISGNMFDEAIRRYALQNRHLSIGKKSAEYLKMRVGTVSSLNENKLTELKGRDTITSLPTSLVISANEIKQAILPLMNSLAMSITDVLSMTPPELVSDVARRGLILSGGGALIQGIAEFLKSKLNIPVRVADKPFDSVSLGLKRFIHNLEEKE